MESMGNILQNGYSNSNNADDDDKVDRANISKTPKPFKVDQEELLNRLNPIQYSVTQEKATESPYSGIYNEHREPGEYICVVCEQQLFKSDSKFDSHCGWPAFKGPVAEQNVELTNDVSHNMVRTEVNCNKCGSHLGHVFDDGPLPSRTRYCINSAALNFMKKIPK